MKNDKYMKDKFIRIKEMNIKHMYIEDIYKKYKISKTQYLMSLLKGVLIILIISYLFYENLLYAIILMPYVHIYIKNAAQEIQRKRKQGLLNQFKDGMLAVSFSLNVGYSVENSFKEALGELILLYGDKSDIVIQFQNINHRIDMNENIEDVLDDFVRKSEIEDILYFAEVFRYAKRSGGDLITIIRNTANTISEKINAKNEIETVISGKQMEQKIMSIVPFGIILYLKLSSPEFIEGLYGNVVGIVVMTVCLVLYILSYWLAQRIVRIEV